MPAGVFDVERSHAGDHDTAHLEADVIDVLGREIDAERFEPDRRDAFHQPVQLLQGIAGLHPR